MIGAAGDVAQDGVGGEEDGGLFGSGDIGKRGCHLEIARHGGDMGVAGAAGEGFWHADEIVFIALGRGDAVRRAGGKLLPLRVIQQVMLGIGL